MCPPLLRARQAGDTAAAQITVTIDERLREIDVGPFEGLTGAEIEAGPLPRSSTDGDPTGSEFRMAPRLRVGCRTSTVVLRRRPRARDDVAAPTAPWPACS
jgi:broad specificity phosphatase PhoE